MMDVEDMTNSDYVNNFIIETDDEMEEIEDKLIASATLSPILVFVVVHRQDVSPGAPSIVCKTTTKCK